MAADLRARAGRARTVAALLGCLLLALALAGCETARGSSGSGRHAAGAPAAARVPTARVTSYVALGDSFTAAPYVPVTDLAGGCLRSSGNYPARLATLLGATVRDVSCSGARTSDITGRQVVASGLGRVPAQIRAVGPGTDLVTVGIGGNDQDVFGTLVTTCVRRLSGQRGAPCADRLRDRLGGDPARVLADTGRRVAAALRAVRRAAPEAQVVLVGYPRLVDADHGCRRFPLAPADRPLLARLEGRLDRALAGAARRAGAGFVDLRALSRGHEVCSADPWVNGIRTDQRRALAFHPFAVEQQAVADRIARLVG